MSCKRLKVTNLLLLLSVTRAQTVKHAVLFK